MLGRLLCLTALLLGFAAANQHTYGMAGHQAVAYIASKLLKPEAAKEVGRLLALPFEQPPPPQPKPAPAPGTPAPPAPLPPPTKPANCLLCDQANWADFIKFAPVYSTTGKLHISDGPDWTCKYVRSRDCPGGQCVEQAIQAEAAKVANKKLDDKARSDAVRFLTHYVGDIHQPLHVAFASDQGGNLIKGTIANEPGSVSLHLIWDYVIVNRAAREGFGNNVQTWADSLVKRVNKAWTSCNRALADCSEQWAQEAASLACSAAYTDVDGKTRIKNDFKLTDAYYKRAKPVVETQIIKAGARLAEILNKALAGAPAKASKTESKTSKTSKTSTNKPTNTKPATNAKPAPAKTANKAAAKGAKF